MDTNSFSKLCLTFATLVSRRSLLITASGLATVPAVRGLAEIEAKRRGKRKGKPHRKRKRQRPRNPTLLPPPGAVIATAAACSAAGNTGLGSTSGNARLAQTFTASASGALVRAELGLIKGVGTVGEYVVRISPVDSSGVPTNEILGAATAPDLSVPEGSSLVGFTFANPLLVTAGTQYALVLTRPGSNQVQWDGDLNGGCPGEIFISSNETAPFEEFALNLDLRFAIFVRL